MPSLKRGFLSPVFLMLLLVSGISVAAAQSPARDAAPSRPAVSRNTAYLFAYFINNGEDGLHLAASVDGLKWEALNGAKSYLTPAVGESKLMRDPCLLLGPDGVFRMVWTTAWKGQTIGYASSKDLIHWSAQQAIPVMAHEPGTGNCWAPEINYNKVTKDYLIYWSSTITGKFDNTHRAYAITTADFKTFTPARLFFDPGYNAIDETIVEHGGRFIMLHKDEREDPVKKNLRLAFSDSLEGPYGNVTEPFTRDWVEGPTLLKVGGEFIVYFDCYRDHHYGAMKTKDFVKWEDVTDQLVMPRGVRHGTALAVPAAVVEKLKAAPPKESGSPAPAKMESSNSAKKTVKRKQ